MSFTPQQYPLSPSPANSAIQVGAPVLSAGDGATLLYNSSSTVTIYLSGNPNFNINSTDHFQLPPQSALLLDGTESVYAAVVTGAATLQAIPGSVQFASGIVTASTVIIFGTSGGLFIFNGVPALGNNPILSISDASSDPVGNEITPSLSLAGLPELIYSSAPMLGNLIAAISGSAGTDNFGNPYVAGAQFGAPGTEQISLIPNANTPLTLTSAVAGIFAGIAQLDTTDSDQVFGGIVGSAILGSGTTAKMSSLVSSPFGTQGSCILLTAQNDGGTDTAWVMICATSTPDDETLVITPLMWIAPYALVLYGGQSGTVVVTKTSGSGNIPIPADAQATGKGESWGSGGGAGTSSNFGAAGAGGGEYAQEPALAITPGGNVAYSVGAGGVGGIPGGRSSTNGNPSTLTGSAVTVTANGGQKGTGTNTPGDGGTGSTNTIHNNGGNGGTTETNATGGGGGGSSAGPGGAGGNGQEGKTKGGAGGVAPSGGGDGGAGGNNGDIGTNGFSPGGGGGGGGADAEGGDGFSGQVRLTYSTGNPTVLASFASAATTDPFGTSIPANGMVPPLVAIEPGTADTPESWHYVGTAGQPAFGSGWSNVGSPNEDLAFKLLAEENAVWIKGYVNNATAANTASIFTLPTGYRPNSQQFFTMTEDPNSTITLKALLVTTAGVVELAPGLAPAGAGNYLIDCILSLDI